MSTESSEALATNSSGSASYLLFRLGGELFGVDLLTVLEVKKIPEIKPVPYMKPAFKGVVNLRGQIVGVVDLRAQFDIKSEVQNLGMILILDTPGAPMAAIVDELVSVEEILDSQIDREPLVETKVPTKFLMGIAKKNERLMTLIDIAGCLAETELRSVQQKGKAA